MGRVDGGRVDRWCLYRDLDCLIEREDGDEVELVYLAGNAFAATEAGMAEIDRGVFRARVRRSELEREWEVRTPR